jgi:ADP-ribosyl-[dinitrogen reductase] hydrolase
MTASPIPLADRIGGGLLGLLIGDALGVPYEFHEPHQIPPTDEIEFVPPPGFSPSHRGVPPGTWSDDGAQAICLLASLLDCDSLNLENFAAKLVSWYEKGAFTPDRRIFDCGIQTRRAIGALMQGAPAESSGPSGEYDNGNGSLMRVLPLALWHKGPDERLVWDAHRQSAVTHGHSRAMVCCALYCLWARELLQGASDGWPEAAQKLAAIYQGSAELTTELDYVLDPMNQQKTYGSGYVLDTLWSSRRVLEHTSYQAVVRQAIRLGNDTDTTACVAGGLAGIRGGVHSIPQEWRESLRGSEVYSSLLGVLLERIA